MILCKSFYVNIREVKIRVLSYQSFKENILKVELRFLKILLKTEVFRRQTLNEFLAESSKH